MHPEDFELVSAIASYLRSQAARVAEPLPLGGAVAVLSWAAGGRYVVDLPPLIPAMEGDVDPYPVTQSVMLVGPAGSGKGQVMEGVERLVTAVEGPAAFAAGFASKVALEKAARATPGLLWVIRNETHERLATREPEYLGREPALSAALLEIQLGMRPEIRPLTLLGETTPGALGEGVPEWLVMSKFYGDLLFVPAVSPRPRLQAAPVKAPPDELVRRISDISSRRRDVESVLVAWTHEAREACHQFLTMAITGQDVTVMVCAHRFLNVATLLAISEDPDQPAIHMRHMEAAIDLAALGHQVTKSGLDSSEPPTLN